MRVLESGDRSRGSVCWVKSWPGVESVFLGEDDRGRFLWVCLIFAGGVGVEGPFWMRKWSGVKGVL